MRKGNEFRAVNIYKTENIKFLSARKDIYFHKVIGNITVNSYLRFILSRIFALLC
ncbi:hypothetical protein BANRA_03959 [Klebsiella pneumoniae]|nr:hypothetical protein BANRA_03959 [Klebsiella pneumoniae]VCY16251.1 hypothetical protein BANRA_04215 [Klebsiella pneumoniae]